MKPWSVPAVLALNVIICSGCVAQSGSLDASHTLQRNDSSEIESFRARVAEAYPNLPAINLDDAPPASATNTESTSVTTGEATPALMIEASEPPRIAIFAKNQSTKRYLDDEIDPLRDYITAELAGQGMIILDPKDIVESFNRYKVTTMEERMGLVDGLFTGGSVARVGQIIGADYLALVSLLNADVRSRNVGGRPVSTFGARFSVRVFEASQGSSVFGENFHETYPVTTDVSSADEITYFHDLVNSAGIKIGAAMISSASKWRSPEPAETRMVSFKVSTTIDALINGLENGVRAPNELLDEMRRIVGGVTVELDGLAIGSSPGTFKSTPGVHQLRLTRQWIQPWQRPVNIQEGAEFNIGLELSTEGLAKFQSLEGFRAAVAVAYAEAAWRKGIKVNYDTAAWRDVTHNIGNRGDDIILEQQKISQEGLINQVEQ